VQSASALFSHFRGLRGTRTLHQLEGADGVAELLPLVDIGYGEVKGRLHQPGYPTLVNKPRHGGHLESGETNPRGPPLSTKRSKSRPDMRTAAPLSTCPRTFSGSEPMSAVHQRQVWVKEPTCWDKTVVEYKFSGVASSHAEFVQLSVRRKAREPSLDDEGCDALGALLR
jgi:hypothetical protein